jgi:uncharacterized HAD superfamily protein
MIYAVDIDGTLCVERNEWWHYDTAEPIKEAINKVNELFGQDHVIILFTSRFEEDRLVTREWLKKHKVRYTKLVMDKPRADIYIDNAAKRMDEI